MKQEKIFEIYIYWRIRITLETLCHRIQDTVIISPEEEDCSDRGVRDGHFRLANINVVSLVCTVFGSLPGEIIRDIIQDVDIR